MIFIIIFCWPCKDFLFCCKIHGVRLVFNKVHLAKIHSLPICWLTISVHIFCPSELNFGLKRNFKTWIGEKNTENQVKLKNSCNCAFSWGFDFIVEFRPKSRLASDGLAQLWKKILLAFFENFPTFEFVKSSVHTYFEWSNSFLTF